jgi:Leucine-rich repeat (LRR) protein
MKTKRNLQRVTSVLIILLTLSSGCEKDEQVKIPDSNFINALISWGVDKNGDGQISTAEAEAIDTLSVMDKSISDLTGIEAFVNLIYLDCWINQLTSLDVSNNTDLQNLICSNNQLTTLNISNNTALKELACGSNQLINLDVSNNIALESLGCKENQLNALDVSNNTALVWLSCENNQLTALDVSDNTELQTLICSNNQLTTLNISNNTDLVYLGIDGMPSLYKVCVWVVPFPLIELLAVNSYDSPNVYYTTDCSK